MPRLFLLLFALLTALPAAAQPAELNLGAVTRLIAEAPPEARSARTLGERRDGNGVVIDGQGLVLTIGYLILEAQAVTVYNADGKPVPAQIVAYDYETGFGLVRALAPLGRKPLQLGNSASLKVKDPMLAVGHGGRADAVPTFVTSRRAFAGGWEYLVDEAIFTAPPHPNWGGTALIGVDGKLYGIGSLQVGQAGDGEEAKPGNMFVPIDLLKPIFADLLADGKANVTQKPWLGMTTAELMGRLVVTQVTPGGPAQKAGVQPGDVVSSVGGKRFGTMVEFYRTMWTGREAGSNIDLRLVRSGETVNVRVKSGSRYEYLKPAKTY